MKRKHYKRSPATDASIADDQHTHCKEFIQKMLDDEACVSFNSPVTEMWTHDEIPGYFDIVKKPMDFRTIKENLAKQDVYFNDSTTLFDYRMFMDDVFLIFDNCFAYNENGTDLYNLASELEGEFNDHMKDLPRKKDSIQAASRSKDGMETAASASATTTTRNKEAASDSDDEIKMKERESEDEFAPAEDEKMEEKDSDESAADEEGGTEAAEVAEAEPEEPKDEAAVEELRDARRKLDELRRRKAKSLNIIAKIDEERSGYKSERERVELRDMIESANWGVVDKVVRILQKYVEKELDNTNDKDPEFVTLEMNNIEPDLLRQVEDVVRPDPRRDEEMEKVSVLEQEIAAARNTVNVLKRAAGRSGDRKKSKRRR